MTILARSADHTSPALRYFSGLISLGLALFLAGTANCCSIQRAIIRACGGAGDTVTLLGVTLPYAFAMTLLLVPAALLALAAIYAFFFPTPSSN